MKKFVKKYVFFCRIEKGPYWRQLRSTLAHEHDLHFMSNFVILSNFENSKLGWHRVATLLKLRSAADIPSLASALSEGESSHLLLKLLMIFHHFFHHFLEIVWLIVERIAKKLFQLPYGQHHREPAGGLDPTGWDWNRWKSAKPWFSVVFHRSSWEADFHRMDIFCFSVVFVAVSPGVPLFCLSHSANYARGLRPTLRRSHEVMKSSSHEVSRSVFVPLRARPSRGTAASYVLRVMSLGLDHSFEVSRDITDITFKCF